MADGHSRDSLVHREKDHTLDPHRCTERKWGAQEKQTHGKTPQPQQEVHKETEATPKNMIAENFPQMTGDPELSPQVPGAPQSATKSHTTKAARREPQRPPRLHPGGWAHSARASPPLLEQRAVGGGRADRPHCDCPPAGAPLVKLSSLLFKRWPVLLGRPKYPQPLPEIHSHPHRHPPPTDAVLALSRSHSAPTAPPLIPLSHLS